MPPAIISGGWHFFADDQFRNTSCCICRTFGADSVIYIDLLIQEHSKHTDNQYMFPSPATGEMYHPDSVAKFQEKILKDADLEHIPLHGFRPPFATAAFQNGVDVKPSAVCWVTTMQGLLSAPTSMPPSKYRIKQQKP